MSDPVAQSVASPIADPAGAVRSIQAVPGEKNFYALKKGYSQLHGVLVNYLV